uniref:Probable acetate kinase n=1 Tax=Alexandrium catenella TaxID=2925 RepID=A0A7S1MMM7_ALECA
MSAKKKTLQLVLNCGSSSIKYALFLPALRAGHPTWTRLVQGLAEGIGTASQCRIKHETKEEGKVVHQLALPDHRVALNSVVDLLPKKYRDFVGSVGHRVVHGGEHFNEAAVIDEEILDAIKQATVFAPLHNPWNLLGIEVVKELLGKECPQVAVFDTAFHQTMPPHAFMYAIPIDLYEKHGIRRYGFHGTSYLYVCEEAAKAIGRPLESMNIIACHIGNGASMCAVEGGRCIDTTMGLTPLEGLVMGTRCGDLDPALPEYLISNFGYSSAQVNDMLNKESGLLGMCGTSDDRDVERRYFDEEPTGTLAKKVQVHRMRKYLGAFVVALRGRVDALVFTGGLGEKSHLLRTLVCEGLDEMGFSVDEARNMAHEGRFSEDTRIHKDGSKTQIWVIPTDEELCIAKQAHFLVHM